MDAPTGEQHDEIALGPTRYGKSAIRVVKVTRQGERHALRDLNVDIALEGDFAAAYSAGDNRSMLATDTMRNTVYALAQGHSLESSEAFGLTLARHFLGAAPGLTRATVRLTEYPWGRLEVGGAGHAHAFSREAGERTATVVADAAGAQVTAGIANLLVLKTTASGWQDFYRDRYTTLPDADDRILATILTAEWEYGARDDLDFERIWAGVRARILESFTDHYSPSVQHTLYRMGRAALESFPELVRISFRLPNKHHLLFNLAPFGLENPNQIFQVTSEPYGLIEGTLERRG